MTARRRAELPAVPRHAENGYVDNNTDTEIVSMLLAPARTPDATLDRRAARPGPATR